KILCLFLENILNVFSHNLSIKNVKKYKNKNKPYDAARQFSSDHHQAVLFLGFSRFSPELAACGQSKNFLRKKGGQPESFFNIRIKYSGKSTTIYYSCSFILYIKFGKIS